MTTMRHELAVEDLEPWNLFIILSLTERRAAIVVFRLRVSTLANRDHANRVRQ